MNERENKMETETKASLEKTIENWINDQAEHELNSWWLSTKDQYISDTLHKSMAIAAEAVFDESVKSQQFKSENDG